MKTYKRYLSFTCASVLLLACILACSQRGKQPEWTKARKIAGSQQALSHVSGLMIDDKFAYVTIGGTIADQNEGKSGLRKIALDSGAVTSLDQGDMVPQSDYGGLAIDEKYIYWNAGGNIRRISKDGGKPETIASITSVSGLILLSIMRGSTGQITVTIPPIVPAGRVRFMRH